MLTTRNLDCNFSVFPTEIYYNVGFEHFLHFQLLVKKNSDIMLRRENSCLYFICSNEEKYFANQKILHIFALKLMLKTVV